MGREFLKWIVIAAMPLAAAGCKVAAPPSPSLPPAVSGAPSAESKPQEVYVFGWGYQPQDRARPRGGTSTGTPVTYAAPRERSVPAGATPFERDRSAILELAGDYRVGFHFMETLGFDSDYTNSRPYSSWATEHVRVLEDRGAFISLQHTLVMFFEGQGESPIVTKHWRQDWTYQDTNLFVFKGNRTWARETRSAESVAGAWSQAVFQVDDSPRYEVVGRWEHRGNSSHWLSERDWRPLPRREFSTRGDYDVLEGTHEIVLTPRGWVHFQSNWKRVAGESGEPSPEFRAHEWGLNRYERISAPDLGAADRYWQATGPYWASVRKAWQEVMAGRDRFKLRPRNEGKQLFEVHFEFAEPLEKGGGYDTAEGERHARETLNRFIE